MTNTSECIFDNNVYLLKQPSVLMCARGLFQMEILMCRYFLCRLIAHISECVSIVSCLMPLLYVSVYVRRMGMRYSNVYCDSLGN